MIIFKNNRFKEPFIKIITKNILFILLMIFALFVMFSFGILIHDISRQKQSQEQLFMEEKAQLTDMTSYLNEIGEAVAANQDRLAQSMLFQTDTEQTLLAYQEQLSLLEKNLAQIETVLENHLNTEQFINSEIALSLTELSERHQELKSQITSIHSGITEMLSIVRHENDEHFSATFEKLLNLQKALDKTQNNTKTYYDDLTALLTLLNENSEFSFTISFEKLDKLQHELNTTQEKNQNYYDDLSDFLTLLKESNDTDTNITFEKLNLLREEFLKEQEADKEHYDNLSNFLNLVKEENNTQKKELSDQFLLVRTEITELLKINFSSLQLKLEENYLSLIQEMESLHSQIQSTHLSIAELLTLMEEADKERQEEIKSAFASVNESIELIRTEYNNTHTNLKNLIQTVQETQISNHEETLSVLSEVEINLEEVSSKNLEQLNNSLQIMKDNFSNSITTMQQTMNKNFSDLNTEIRNSFFQTNSDISNKLDQMTANIFNQHKELSTNISNHYQEMTTTIHNSNGNQQESFDNLMTYLEQKLSQVFQSVSNGKKKVVSALLTKGIYLEEDATFAQIHDAILSIEQQLLIGVQQIPGNITYQYHYHLNGKNQYPHTQTCPPSDNGGCYTSPIYHYHTDHAGTVQAAGYQAAQKGGCFITNVYHSHTGSSTGNSGCYTTPVYHQHTGNSSQEGGCYGSVPYTAYKYCECTNYVYTILPGYEDHPTCGNCYHNHSSKCGAIIDSYLDYKIDLTCGKSTSTIDKYTIGCGMNASSVIGYSLGCGMTTSTITAFQPGCGLSDGQIIGASIIYNQNAISTVNVPEIPQQENIVSPPNEVPISDNEIIIETEIIQPSNEFSVSGNEIIPENSET